MTRKEHIKKQREAHHKALEKLTGRPGEGLKIWRRLRRLEAEAHKLAEDYCNGVKDTVPRLNEISLAAQAVVGRTIYLNTDPRGYALKLAEGAPDYGLHRDWGGYQILAPEIV